MSIRYKEYKHLNLPGIAAEMLAEWDSNKVFEKSVQQREGVILLFFMKARQALMVCLVSIMLFPEP
ncbi:MAG: hypothetical protein WKF59_08490 [Chitinophagaceae bacterium]